MTCGDLVRRASRRAQTHIRLHGEPARRASHGSSQHATAIRSANAYDGKRIHRCLRSIRSVFPGGSVHATFRLAFFNGNWRIRLPVAANIAFSTAGAATAIVGSPTPPQKPPEGITIVSTSGISDIRMDR